MRELILGGARSGKSTLALQRARDSGREVTYIATATAGDAEMQARITQHRNERPDNWRTVEVAVQLADALMQVDRNDGFIIVDCLTLLLSNVLCVGVHGESMQLNDNAWQHERSALLKCLPKLQASIVLVSNEVGMSIVPDNALARRFRDEQGWLNQSVASCCEHVTFVAAGLPLILKRSV